MVSARSVNTLDVSRLTAICNAIGNETGDETGFVSVRSLLTRFRASLIMRPLLVEAMIATVAASSTEGKAGWAVLVDSERYAVNDDDITKESAKSPLPARFRNTIAHELVHSLAFRSTEFGIELNLRAGAKASRSDFVAAVERATERMSPLILLPERTLKKVFAGKVQPLSADDLRSICKNYGVSRYVLINRLMMLRDRSDLSDLREHAALTNLAVGLGQWTPRGDAILRKWPLFINFRDGIVPHPLLRLAREDRRPGNDLSADENCALCGGDSLDVQMTCDAGLPETKSSEKMTVRLTVETTQKLPGSEFLFAVTQWPPAELPHRFRTNRIGS